MKSHRILIAVAALIGVFVIGVQAYTIWPQPAAENPITTETKTIDQSQGIGGVALAAPKSQAGTQSAPAPAHETTLQNDKITLPEDAAPKQTEIKKSVNVELPYRALRTSNDPLPQPTWISSGLKTNAAWDSTTGNGIVVAVVDTGFALNHEDLTNQWYQNAAETGMTANGERCWTGSPAAKQSNNCDDDNNGYKDDWRGWDFSGVNNNPQAGDTNPAGAGVAHGTEVAGLVGATGNNGIGTASVSWNNKIMPLQALDDNGSGYTSSVAAAVYYAVDNGAKVINMSLGGDTNDTALATAIKYAYERGVVVVAAAGNCGTGTEQGCNPSMPGAMGYPALNPYVISVGATTSTGVRASFSSYGPGLDVIAPGSGTLVSPMWHSTNQTSAYATSLYGTSFASPIVSSYVGLLKSIRPSSSVDDITALVDATAGKLSGMGSDVFTTQYGHGLIDTQAGLRVAAGLNQTAGTTELLQTGSSISEHTFQTTSRMASGCEAQIGAYCTVWAQSSAGYDRFLPYSLGDANGKAGWSWTGTWLGSGDWKLRARSGDIRSPTPYGLFNR